MNINDEYFVIESVNNNDYPILSWGETKSLPAQKINPVKELTLQFSNPPPENPKMVDYHILPEPVISSKISDILIKHDIPNIQFIPTKIKYLDRIYEEYFILHIFNAIKCMDLDNSKIDYDEELEIANDVSSFMLDHDILSKIPLKDRLIFFIQEWPTLYICHQHIAQLISSTNPVGIRFIPVKHWNDDIDY